MIDYDEIRKEVAIRHGVLLGENDPILVTVTLNELVLQRYVETISDQSESHQKALAATLAAHTEQSKETAGRVITDAASYVSGEVRQAVTAALTEVGAQLRQDITEARLASQKASTGGETARGASTVAIVASGIAALCAVVALASVAVILLR